MSGKSRCRGVRSASIRMLSLILVTLMFVGLMFTRSALAQSDSQIVTLTGWVSCTTCLLPNTCKAQTRRSCVWWWVNQGAAYALVVGTRHYRLLGPDKELKKLSQFAGSTVTITGEQFRTDVTVTSVQVE